MYRKNSVTPTTSIATSTIVFTECHFTKMSMPSAWLSRLNVGNGPPGRGRRAVVRATVSSSPSKKKSAASEPRNDTRKPAPRARSLRYTASSITTPDAPARSTAMDAASQMGSPCSCASHHVPYPAMRNAAPCSTWKIRTVL